MNPDKCQVAIHPVAGEAGRPDEGLGAEAPIKAAGADAITFDSSCVHGAQNMRTPISVVARMLFMWISSNQSSKKNI